MNGTIYKILIIIFAILFLGSLGSMRVMGKIDKQTESYEYVMLALRLSEGFSLIEYKNKFGLDFLNPHRKEKIDEYIKLGFMDFSNGRITLTDKGFYVSNTILTELL